MQVKKTRKTIKYSTINSTKKLLKPKILFIPKNFYKTNTINVVRG